MMTASQMIERLGGSRKAADRLGVPFTTVDTWKRKNAIPSWRMPAVEAALREPQSAAA